MGWTSTAPTMPDGSSPSYKSAGSVGRSSSVYNCSIEFAYARLDKNNIAIRFKLTASSGSSAYYPPGYVNFTVGSSTKNYGWATSLTRWWTGTLNENATVKVKAGGSNSTTSYDHATYGEKTITGPAYVTKYTITYHSNNGAGSTATQSKTYGTAVNLYSCGWTKTGHAFVRWNTAADGSGTGYNAGQSYSTNAGLTLYAIWAPDSYAVSYNGNGSTGGSTSGQTKTYGVTLTLRGNGYTKTGHHFLRWNTAADGTGTSYSAGGSYTANAAVTLYAIWEPDTYAVSYEANGAESGSTAAQAKTYGKRLVISDCGFIRNGWGFTGWNTAADGSGTGYGAGDYYETDAPMTLYAQWRKLNIPVFINDNGTVKQVEKAYINDNGTIKECAVYINDNGTIRKIE